MPLAPGGLTLRQVLFGAPASDAHLPEREDWLRYGEGLEDEILAILGKPLVVFAWGQSNMRGIESQVITPPTPNPLVFAWNSSIPATNGTAFNVAKIGQFPFPTNNANSPAYHFCDDLQRRTGRPVYLIVVAAGGHHIEAFMNPVDLDNNGWSKDPGDTDLYDFMVNQIDAALSKVPGGPSKIDYVIGHQGDANREDQVEVYAEKLRFFYKRLEARGVIDGRDCQIIMGELCDGADNGRYKDRHAAALRRLQMGTYEDSFPLLKVVQTHGLQPVAQNDELHFSPADITALGKRFSDAAFRHQEIDLLDPTTCDLSVDGGLGWNTNQVAAQTHVSYWRRQPIYLKDTPFTIENNGTMGWCYAMPANQSRGLFSRAMLAVPREAQFMIELDVLNPHPSASGNYRVGVVEYDSAKSYIGLNLGPNLSIAAGTRSQDFGTFGSAQGSRDNLRDFSASCRWFAPLIQFNWGGSGAGMRFNVLGMRWG